METNAWGSEGDSDSDWDADVVVALVLQSQVRHDLSRARQRGGSRRGKRANIHRGRAEFDRLLRADYFDASPTYDDSHFRRRFRMQKRLFLQIARDLAQHDPYFEQRSDATGLRGFSTIQKVACCVRYLATGCSMDDLDDRYRIAESTMRQALQRFCLGILELYKDKSLREPTEDDTLRLLREAELVGWPGMLGSLDCSHYVWKNCPKAWAGQFQGAKGAPTIVLEAVSDMHGRIWHAYFGMPGANNDINVLDSSDVFLGTMRGTRPRVTYQVNGNTYTTPYWLVDGIYPAYAVFVKSISNAKSQRERAFQKAQESRRKDVERMFGMLQARWHVLTRPCELWDRHAMHDVVMTCCVLHNMIIDDEMDEDPSSHDYLDDIRPSDPFIAGETNQTLHSRLRAIQAIIDGAAHTTLLHDLVEHRWNSFGSETLDNV